MNGTLPLVVLFRYDTMVSHQASSSFDTRRYTPPCDAWGTLFPTYQMPGTARRQGQKLPEVEHLGDYAFGGGVVPTRVLCSDAMPSHLARVVCPNTRQIIDQTCATSISCGRGYRILPGVSKRQLRGGRKGYFTPVSWTSSRNRPVWFLFKSSLLIIIFMYVCPLSLPYVWRSALYGCYGVTDWFPAGVVPCSIAAGEPSLTPRDAPPPPPDTPGTTPQLPGSLRMVERLLDFPAGVRTGASLHRTRVGPTTMRGNQRYIQPP